VENGRDTPDEQGAPRNGARSPEKSSVVNLQASLRRARLESAERSDALGDLRVTEAARLDILRERIEPIIAEAQQHSDMFDLALSQGERPRLFIDMLGFVEMARDKRFYCFAQDTRHGRVLIAESDNIEKMASAISEYAARRLIEREKALAADALFNAPLRPQGAAAAALAPRPAMAQQTQPQAPAATPATATERVVASGGPTPPRARPRLLRVATRAFLFLAEFLGSAALFAALAFGAWWLWTHYAL
jgi:hypothetical protein